MCEKRKKNQSVEFKRKKNSLYIDILNSLKINEKRLWISRIYRSYAIYLYYVMNYITSSEF